MDVRLYLFTLTYSDQTWFVLWQPWPKTTCTVSAQCHLVVWRYGKFTFSLIFWTVWTKLVIRFGAAWQVERFPIFPCQPFWVLAILNFVGKCFIFTNVLAYRFECLWHHALTVQCLATLKSYNEISKNANNFWLN